MKSFRNYFHFLNLIGSVVIVNLSLVRSNSEVGAISSSFETKSIYIHEGDDFRRKCHGLQYLLSINGGTSEETVQAGENNSQPNESSVIEQDVNDDTKEDLQGSEINHEYEDIIQEPEDDDASEKSVNDDKNLPTVEVMIEASDDKDTLELHSKASALRSDGKYLHDDGKFLEAATTFESAVELLDKALLLTNDEKMSNEMAQERATCRLHEALCYLKEKNYPNAIRICTDVLKDGVQVIEVKNNVEEPEDGLASDDDNPNPFLIRVSPESDTTSGMSDQLAQLSPAVRARAYHRRAKARLALDDTTGALEDAKAAAFLGDRNAVALYGKLMRESGSHQNMFGDDDFGKGYGDGSLADLFSSQGSGQFDSLFSGNSPGSGLGLLGSLMNGSGSSTTNSPFGGFGDMLSNGKGDGDLGSLAKSVLVSISKRIEDESTQESICKYLNAVDTAQVMSLSSMAGIPLSESTAGRLVSFANGLTPKRMMKSVQLLKRIIFIGGLWCKSAIMRPVVIKNAAKKSIESVNKAAFII